MAQKQEITFARASSFVHQQNPTKPPPKPLAPPLNISPLIRTARWAALIAGLTYGVYHNRHLVKKEKRHAEHEAKLAPAREAAVARAKAINNREEMITLANQFGLPIPADFEDQYKLPDSKVVVAKKH